LSISRAVAYLASLNEQGEDPLQSPQVFNPPSHERSLSDFCALFLDSIKNLQETAAFGVINQTLEKYPLDRLFTGVLQPAMVEIGEAWHRKEIPIAVEHFGTQIVLQFLMGRLTAAAHPTRPGSMVAACAPGEDHQLGILMLVVMLKERGWDVRYLGPDLKLERLYDATQPIQPHMFLFSATRPETAESLHELAETIEDFPKPYPMIVLGGQAFTGFRLPNNLPAVYMDSDLNTSLSMIEFLLTKSRTEGRQA
jgi:methanogenic corrinoid protein MtbC1